MEGCVLDTGALIALERRGKQQYLTALLRELGREGEIIVSAGSLAEAWRGTPRQAALAMLLRRPSTQVVEITVPVAKAIGVFLGLRQDGDDLVDAHVVMLARRHHVPVITTDPSDLRALDPKLTVLQI
ncbi:PIN domain-containing protein [Actinomadura rudentiformis]|nr:PIN domain-containing protein [Actinomadura rudentiformis]